MPPLCETQEDELQVHSVTPELGTLSGSCESLCEHQRLEVGAGGLAGAEVSDPRGECDSHCSSLQPLSRDRLLPTRMTQGQFPWESAQAGSDYSSFPQRLSLQALSAHPSGVCHIPSSPWPELASES